jgi:hypothetical protein
MSKKDRALIRRVAQGELISKQQACDLYFKYSHRRGVVGTPEMNFISEFAKEEPDPILQSIYRKELLGERRI